MKPDGTSSFSTADEKIVSPEGNYVTELEVNTGSEVKACRQTEGQTWSYIFMHHNKVKSMEEQLVKDNRTYFVHKTVHYYRKSGKRQVQKKEMPTVSGLVFFKGCPKEIQSYLDNNFPNCHLCKNCSTGKVAEIPDSQMQPFMRVAEISPERIRFLFHPYHYYARNRILLRITTGELAGLEGYIIRIDRDRRLVMNIGGMSVAISGVHAEHFEEVEQGSTSLTDENIFYQRNLQERQVLIDRYFHPVKSDKDVASQAENIDYLRKYVLDEMHQSHININDAWNIYSFIIEEIGYYYSAFLEQFKDSLAPIMREGSKILQEMDSILDNPTLDKDTKGRYQTEHEKLMLEYDYLFCYACSTKL